MPEEIIKQLSNIKCEQIGTYPFYPLTGTYLTNNISYVITIVTFKFCLSIRIVPYMKPTQKSEQQKLECIDVDLECLPKKSASSLTIINIKDEVKNDSVQIKAIQFIIGFNCGFLFHCLHTNKNGKKGLKILNKLNKSITHSQSIWSRMNSALFQQQQFYKPSINKPIFSFKVHPSPSKYKMSYMVGNRLFLCTSISEEIERQTIRQFTETEWHTLSINTQAKLKTQSIILNLKKFKAILTSDSIMIEWVSEVCSEYVITTDNKLIIADKDESKIIIYDLLVNLKQVSTFTHDLDIKKIQYYEGVFAKKQSKYLIIIPYDLHFYVLDMTNNSIVCIAGHRSYIANACITKNGSIITGGLDHRILIFFWDKISKWVKLDFQKNEWNLKIESNKIKKQKTSESYFLGEFKNVNEQRNNNIRLGFANFIPFGYQSQLYTFITYDHYIKVYSIKV